MPIMGDRHPFKWDNIRAAPDEAGVYGLFYKTMVIYYACAEGDGVTIRSRLLEHAHGKLGTCTQASTHFAFEINPEPSQRLNELFEEYKGWRNRLPRCNLRELGEESSEEQES